MAKQKYTTKQIEIALRESGGFITHAAKKLGCHYETVLNYLRRSQKLRQVRREIEESYLDLGEIELLKKIKKGDLGAICFYLKCKGKNRGYIERQEITGAEGKDLGVIILPPKNES
jgi:transposase